MTRYVVTLLSAAFLTFALAQGTYGQEQNGRLTGRVVTEETDEPLEGATVGIWTNTSQDSTLVAGTATNSDGRFVVKQVPTGEYVVRISYVGFSERHLRRTESEGTQDLGTIALAEETTRAGEVKVTANRPAARMETDRNVYETSDESLNAGGTARTVLEGLPSVRIDMDGSISFRGSESVSLHINGEPASLSGQSLIGFLESLSAESVKRVEIIPNPSAKYEPTGMAGIINVVLRKDLEAGWNGGVTLGTEVDAQRKYGGNMSGNVGYRSGGWRLSTTYSHRRDSEEDSDSRLLEQFTVDDPNRHTRQSGTQQEVDRSHSLTTRIERSFSESTSLNLETTVSTRGDEQQGETDYSEYLGGISPGNLADRYVRVTESNSQDQSLDGRLGLDHEFGEGHVLSTQLRYDLEREEERGDYGTFGMENGTRRSSPRREESEAINEREQDGSLKVDYERALGDFDVETGYKGTFRRLDNDQTFEGRDRVFTFDEEIHAAYATASRGLGDFSVEAGVRGEAVETIFNLSGQDRSESSYVSLYPSAFLTYKPGPRRQARLSYSKRVDRPNLWHISPLEDNQDPTFRREGNPDLDPEYIHSFELTMTQRWSLGSATVTPYVRHTVNEIERVQRQGTNERGEKIIIFTAENLATSTSYGTELVGTINFGDRVEGRLNGSVYRSVTDGSNLTTDRSQDAVLYSGRANLQFKLRDGLQLNMSQFYRPGRELAPQGRMAAFSSTEMALRQQLFGGSGSLTLRVDDVFDQTQMNMWYRDADIFQESSFQWGSREASVTFQYTFGSSGGGDDDRGRRRGRR